jgi:hypothetical protein
MDNYLAKETGIQASETLRDAVYLGKRQIDAAHFSDFKALKISLNHSTMNHSESTYYSTTRRTTTRMTTQQTRLQDAR